MNAETAHSEAESQRRPRWLDGYYPPQGGWDECVDADGNVRPHWRDAVDLWEQRGSEGRAKRRNAADRYLRDNGVAHRLYGDGVTHERPWPLSHVPLIIDANEWEAIEAGLIQRAHLLEATIADLYGPQNLIADGDLPAPLVAGAPGYLRPLLHVSPPGGYHLHTIAIELGRGPDGRWWVLGDRTQAPSGMGYALENRIALGRGLGNDLNALNIVRLASFFQTLRTTLGGISSPETARVGLLTPGPFNETYYEQAFLARYLGFLLLEGGDLVMHDDALFIRTVRGLRPVDVLWRRLDADYCDPLELRADSQLGVPGLVGAIRSGKLVCANSLGAGIMESRFFMAFAPRLSRKLLGEDLQLPNIATWWMGDPEAAREAADASSPTITLSAGGTSLPVDGRHLVYDAIPEQALSGDTARHQAVTQQIVHLSTLPSRLPSDAGGANPNTGLIPRPFSWRVFLVRNGPDWVVMRGGFCRVADTPDTRALSMQDGSRSADVWIRSREALPAESLLPAPETAEIRRVPGTLPARAADNLFWLGRYAERAQLSIRLARAYLARRLDGMAATDPTLTLISRQLKQWGIENLEQADVFETALLPDIERARQSASSIRDRFSPDAWQSLNRFVQQANSGEFTNLSPIERTDAALGMLAAFTGLISDNMVRLLGWRFLTIGQRIERAIGTSQLAQAMLDPAAPQGSLDLLLEITDSTMSYRQRYSVRTDLRTVADIIILDPNNPRSLIFQLERLNRHIDEITDHKAFDQISDLQRRSFGLWSRLQTAEVDDLDLERYSVLTSDLFELSQLVADRFLTLSERRSRIQPVFGTNEPL